MFGLYGRSSKVWVTRDGGIQEARESPNYLARGSVCAHHVCFWICLGPAL